MNIIRFSTGDTLEMKKEHPCGGNMFYVLGVGSDIKIRCQNCAREMTVPRIKLEKNIKKVISAAFDDSIEKKQ